MPSQLALNLDMYAGAVLRGLTAAYLRCTQLITAHTLLKPAGRLFARSSCGNAPHVQGSAMPLYGHVAAKRVHLVRWSSWRDESILTVT